MRGERESDVETGSLCCYRASKAQAGRVGRRRERGRGGPPGISETGPERGGEGLQERHNGEREKSGWRGRIVGGKRGRAVKSETGFGRSRGSGWDLS